ncbi:MAG: 30S ribosomal protein S18 [Candidatus Woesebacteria bacterium GW2011_GWA2_40_7]|uniref:Small ribosomal subunit protein bS18 n=3 Tax=Candidatus Woeseibacteriota TaxID=1752722 RepID=A0A0G0UUT1_9BACT|nr:MAG: 30S ribosomal protein S18 [Candidatus Woesebacteria bacterium GW2011_GWB1_39_10]KKR73096.1 MAG: 30S ribosomal protein S18 [Candidatus Woesebacteria bacterium GW2011_GWA2_40_7]KKR92519.1 MAG: 30S ribosomal protein S18 [Candidatus Woesebacteria bacterium GW2011_GWA1_41_13b]
MAKKKDNKKRRILKEAPVARNCPFDKNKTEPDYKDIGILTKYISDRAKLLGKDRTGLCAKHQRRVALSIKRARHLALLPYTPRI